MLALLLVGVFFWYASYTTSFWRATGVFISLLIGSFLLEYSSLHFLASDIFRYQFYLPGPQIADVPISIIFGWTAVIYLVYSVTNAILKLSQKKSSKKLTFVSIFSLAAVDAILATSLDLLADPIAVHLHQWSYSPVGTYYGVPLINFIGWLIVVMVFSFIMRTVDFYYPSLNRIKRPILFLPIGVYALIYAIFSLLAIYYGLGGTMLVSFGGLLISYFFLKSFLAT